MKSKNKIVAGLTGIFLGGFGVHKFYLGYTNEGLIMLAITLLSGGILGTVIGCIGFVEGVIYLTKSDQEFEELYCDNKKGWF